MAQIKKILVANRGEIALRVMRTCKRLKIKTVAIFSEADKDSLFVSYADEKILIGPALSKLSYLNQDLIIQKAVEINVDAIHPGYGFLSENAAFASKVIKAGIIFIGPSAKSIEVMGDKLSAKKTVSKFDIPLVPGLDEEIKDVNLAMNAAEKIGFPVLIKASAGGGGKGMRIVHKKDEFKEQMQRAVSEAKNSFGNGAVFIEKYVTSPRHIEIQVLADKFGNVVHLFERECSIQRRHQKVIEEAPSSVLTPELRAKMGQCAVDVAKSCYYEGAGTVEFLLDENHEFYFLEMNTRLQVEHPVTEMITGIDLVKQQILVARGEKLSFSQEDLSISGHAIEVRVYAEDSKNNFLPDIGTLLTYRRPGGIGVRVDDGFEEGMEVPIYYDPMISKLITFGKDRDEAIFRMSRAVKDYEISGIQTTLEFGAFVMNHESFISGDFDTHFVAKHFNPRLLKEPSQDELEVAAWFAANFINESKHSRSTETQVPKSKWKQNRL